MLQRGLAILYRFLLIGSPASSFVWQLALSPKSGVTPSMGTVMLYKSAVNKKYLEVGKPSPTSHPVVRATLKGLARLKGSSSRKVEALREYHIEAMLRACPNTLIGKRDAAIIAVGFAGALRRSEICNLVLDDVEFLDSSDDDGDRMWITIRQSKTDQQGKGQRVAILDGKAVRPITHLRLWLESSGITTRTGLPNDEAGWVFAWQADAP